MFIGSEKAGSGMSLACDYNDMSREKPFEISMLITRSPNNKTLLINNDLDLPQKNWMKTKQQLLKKKSRLVNNEVWCNMKINNPLTRCQKASKIQI